MARAAAAPTLLSSGEDVSPLQPEAVSRIEHALVMTVDGVEPVVRSARQMKRVGCPNERTIGEAPDSGACSLHQSVGDRNPSPQAPVLIATQTLENRT